MPNEQAYNGCTNYETWNVALWIDNEQGSHEYWREQAHHAYKFAVDRGIGATKEETAVFDLMGQLKEKFEENAPDLTGCYADLLGAALSEVNWHEIAKNMIEEVDKTESVEAE